MTPSSPPPISHPSPTAGQMQVDVHVVVVVQQWKRKWQLGKKK